MSILECILTILVGGGLLGFIITIFRGKKDNEEVTPSEVIGAGKPYEPTDSVQHDIDESIESAISDALDAAKSATESNINKLKSRPRDSKGRFISTKSKSE